MHSPHRASAIARMSSCAPQVPHDPGNLAAMPATGSGSDEGDATGVEIDVVDPTRAVSNFAVGKSKS